MEKSVVAISKPVGFLIGWVILGWVPLILWRTPSLLSHTPALLQLYREGIPLLAAALLTILLTYWEHGAFCVRFWIGENPGEGFLLGSGIGILLTGGVLGILEAGGWIHFRSQLQQLDSMAIWLTALFLRIVGISLLLHGYLFFQIERIFSPGIAAVVSTTFYFLLCTDFWQGDFIYTCCGIAFGALLAMLRLLTGGIIAPVVVHFFWSFAAGFVLNGIPLDDYPCLTVISLRGPEWLSGGHLGMSGSILTLICTLFCTGIVFAAWRASIRSEK